MGVRAEQKEKRRQELLHASLALFVSKGYGGTTVRDITEKTKTSVGLLFHYFPTKQAILEELVVMARSGITEALKLLAEPLDPLQRFERIVIMIFEGLNTPLTRGLFLLASQIEISDAIPAAVKEKLGAYETVEASLPVIRKGQRLGEIKKGNPLSLSIAFWGAIQGIAEMQTWYPNPPIPDSSCVVDILRAK